MHIQKQSLSYYSCDSVGSWLYVCLYIYIQPYHLQRGNKSVFPISFLAAMIASFTANSAQQLIHIGGSPHAE